MNELDLQMPKAEARIVLVCGQFNRFITDQLLEGARDALARQAVSEENITIAWVPGAYELPLAAERLLASGRYDAIVALGAVIRGGTPHFDYVAGECSRGLTDVSLKYGKPVIFGVLTTDTIEQALERADPAEGNKGFDVTMAALNMLSLLERIGPAEA